MIRRNIIQMTFVIIVVLLASLNTAEAGRLKNLARAALLGAAIAPRFVPVPIPHHVYPKQDDGWNHGWEQHDQEHSQRWDHYDNGWN